jgi:hypothetical protein
VRSAIIMGNQAPNGIRVDNQAGACTQMLANEQSVLALNAEARSHYRVDVGAPGDEVYVDGVHQSERWTGEDKTMRWSTGSTRFHLPVLPGKAYTFHLILQLPAAAVDSANGVYLGKTRIAELPKQAGDAKVSGHIPASDKDSVMLELRVKTWCPQKLVAGSADPRDLGVTLLSLTLKADGATTTQPTSANEND